MDDADIGNPHGLVDGLAHVKYGQCGNGNGGQGFHFDAGFACGLAGRDDINRIGIGCQFQGDFDRGQGQGMAQRYQVGGFLGPHDPGKLGDAKNVALFMAAFGNQPGRFR